jgi:hypothetical protein
VINLYTININLRLVAHHPKIVTQTFHSQLHEQFDHKLLALFSQKAQTTRMKLHPYFGAYYVAFELHARI